MAKRQVLAEKGVKRVFPNLMGQKSYRKLTSEDMGAIIGQSRQSYESKMQSGRFTAEECKKYCKYFGLSFEYLFATSEDLLDSSGKQHDS